MKLYRRDREIHLLHTAAHTEATCRLSPEGKVCDHRDAIRWTPFMGDGYPEDWAATLDGSPSSIHPLSWVTARDRPDGSARSGATSTIGRGGPRGGDRRTSRGSSNASTQAGAEIQKPFRPTATSGRGARRLANIERTFAMWARASASVSRKEIRVSCRPASRSCRV